MFLNFVSACITGLAVLLRNIADLVVTIFEIYGRIFFLYIGIQFYIGVILGHACVPSLSSIVMD